jgi:phage/conjugal plasmid C-4 type zinc finger TraR family protein
MDEVDIANDYLRRSMRAWERSRTVAGYIASDDITRVRCIDCGRIIPLARRRAIPGCVRCVDCQQEYDNG